MLTEKLALFVSVMALLCFVGMVISIEQWLVRAKKIRRFTVCDVVDVEMIRSGKTSLWSVK